MAAQLLEAREQRQELLDAIHAWERTGDRVALVEAAETIEAEVRQVEARPGHLTLRQMLSRERCVFVGWGSLWGAVGVAAGLVVDRL